jgi:hypothetical protein
MANDFRDSLPVLQKGTMSLYLSDEDNSVLVLNQQSKTYVALRLVQLSRSSVFFVGA